MSKQNQDQFGVNLWWSIPEFLMDGDKAQTVLNKHGFEDEDMPLPNRAKAVSRAAYSFQDRRHKNGRRVTEKTKTTSRYNVYGILGQVTKGDEEVAYSQGTTVRYDKESGRVEAEGVLQEEFGTALNRYDGAITDDDVRLFLRKVVRMCKGISKRRHGGIYFIPQKFVSIIDSAKYALEELGVGAKLYVERILNGKQEREIVWEAVETDIFGQIESTLKAVERIEKRASSVKSHEAKLSEMTELMDIYRDLLGQEAKYEEMAERLEDAASLVAQKLDTIQQEGESRVSTSGKPRKVSTTKPAAGSKGRHAIDTAMEVLQESGKPLHYKKIAEIALERGVELGGKNGANWLNGWINETFRNGKTSPFVRHSRGVYGVA